MKRLIMQALVLAMMVAAPQALVARADGLSGTVRLVEGEDTMYAYLRAETEPILDIDDRTIEFNRDPVLMFVCSDGEIDVVYRFDTVLAGKNDAVRIRLRFDDQRFSKRQMWTLARNPTAEMQLEVVMATLGADVANPLFQMMSHASDAARMPRKYTSDFLEAARAANRLAVRVTDPIDGESHTDEFPLQGLGVAIDRLSQGCKVQFDEADGSSERIERSAVEAGGSKSAKDEPNTVSAIDMDGLQAFMGIRDLDITITEIRRDERYSVLHIPGFWDMGTNSGAAWTMCAFTDLAIKRGFNYWVAGYPEPDGEDVLVGFLTTGTEDIAQTLGPEFAFHDRIGKAGRGGVNPGDASPALEMRIASDLYFVAVVESEVDIARVARGQPELPFSPTSTSVEAFSEFCEPTSGKLVAIE